MASFNRRSTFAIDSDAPYKLAHCPGFADFRRVCTNKSGHPAMKNLPSSTIWCERCDRLRIKHLDESFKKIVEQVPFLPYGGTKKRRPE